MKANPFLVLDTQFFALDFKNKLLASVENLDAQLDGLLVRSENFQAIHLLLTRFLKAITCIYIDPPYNTDSSAILYKNDYRHSSWLSLLFTRCESGRELLADDGIMCAAIDDTEFPQFQLMLNNLFGEKNILSIAAVRANPAGRSTPTGFSVAHDYAIFAGRTEQATVGRLERSEKQLARYDEKDDKGAFEWVNFRKHGGIGASRKARPRMYYPFYVSVGKVRVPKIEWVEAKKEWQILEPHKGGEQVVWPINAEGEAKRWKWGVDSVRENLADFCSRPDQGGKLGVYFKSRMNEQGTLPLTWWDKKEYSATEYGTNLLTDIFGKVGLFSFPKSIHLVEDCLKASSFTDEGIVVDFFGGSGTTAHATININRADDGSRKYILVDLESYFDTVLKPRVQKVIYSKDWEGGKPVSREGSSHMFKYIRLESYEDTLNNLELKPRAKEQEELLTESKEFREDYMLRYMLDVESRGSASLLSAERFDDPFGYRLKIATGSVGETKPVAVDLVETFNWLLGLRVKHIEVIRGFTVVQGKNPQDENVLVIWRNTKEKSNADLDDFFKKQQYNTLDQEFDLIYVNGDNNLENLRRPDQSWKVRLTENEFQKLMFDTQDV